MGIPQVTQEIIASLNKLDGAWRKAEPRTSGNLPAGDYLCRIDGMPVVKSKGGNTMVVTDYTVWDGKYKGSKGKKFDLLETQQNLDFFKGYCEVLGIEAPEKMKDLPYALNDFVEGNKSLVWFTVREKDGNTNTSLKAVADETDNGKEPGTEFPGEEGEAGEAGDMAVQEGDEDFIMSPDDDTDQIVDEAPAPAPAPVRRGPAPASAQRQAVRPPGRPATRKPAARR